MIIISTYFHRKLRSNSKTGLSGQESHFSSISFAVRSPSTALWKQAVPIPSTGFVSFSLPTEELWWSSESPQSSQHPWLCNSSLDQRSLMLTKTLRRIEPSSAAPRSVRRSIIKIKILFIRYKFDSPSPPFPYKKSFGCFRFNWGISAVFVYISC